MEKGDKSEERKGKKTEEGRKAAKIKKNELMGKGHNGRGEVRKEEASEGEQSRGSIMDSSHVHRLLD